MYLPGFLYKSLPFIYLLIGMYSFTSPHNPPIARIGPICDVLLLIVTFLISWMRFSYPKEWKR